VPQSGVLVARFGRAVAQDPMLQSDMPACIASLPNFGTHAPPGVPDATVGLPAEAVGVSDEAKYTTAGVKCAAAASAGGHALPVGVANMGIGADFPGKPESTNTN